MVNPTLITASSSPITFSLVPFASTLGHLSAFSSNLFSSFFFIVTNVIYSSLSTAFASLITRAEPWHVSLCHAWASTNNCVCDCFTALNTEQQKFSHVNPSFLRLCLAVTRALFIGCVRSKWESNPCPRRRQMWKCCLWAVHGGKTSINFPAQDKPFNGSYHSCTWKFAS